MCFCTRSCLCSGQKSCRGGEEKERMGRDLASNGRPSSCMGFSGEAGSTASTLMRKWDGKRKKRGVCRLKWDTSEKKKCTEKMKNQSGQNDVWWKRRKWSAMTKRERVRRKGLLTEQGALRWWIVWAVWHGYPSDNQRWWKETRSKHTPRKSESQRMLKMRGSLWKRENVCALVNLLWAEIWKSGEPQQDACSIYWMEERSIGISSS